MTPLLSAMNIKKSFSYPENLSILNGIDLDIFKGESVAITGRSGEGKSTLLHILGMLDTPSSGSLFFLNEKVKNENLLRLHHIGFIFQSFHLLEDLTVLENVLMPARLAGKKVGKGSLAYKRGLELLLKLGIEKRAFFDTNLLSGGEKQRVAIARALCNDPALLLADEPTGNLDHNTSLEIQSLLLSLTEEGKTLLLVTHDNLFAKKCSKSYVLNNGLLYPT